MNLDFKISLGKRIQQINCFKSTLDKVKGGLLVFTIEMWSYFYLLFAHLFGDFFSICQSINEKYCDLSYFSDLLIWRSNYFLPWWFWRNKHFWGLVHQRNRTALRKESTTLKCYSRCSRKAQFSARNQLDSLWVSWALRGVVKQLLLRSSEVVSKSECPIQLSIYFCSL